MTLKELHNPDKTSEAIIHLCDPLRKKYKDKNLKVIISITVMAWNISLFPKEEQANAQEILLRPLLKQIKGDEVSVILKQLKIFIERKNRYYPGIREFIHKHTLSFSGDMATLTVETEKLPEEIKRG